jgi:hypothetical protein
MRIQGAGIMGELFYFTAHDEITNEPANGARKRKHSVTSEQLSVNSYQRCPR